jgi:hypothetical protein
MKATKKDFEFTAALIGAAAKGVSPEALASMAADKFAEGNPRFDVDRFKRACGLTWSEIDAVDSPFEKKRLSTEGVPPSP